MRLCLLILGLAGGAGGNSCDVEVEGSCTLATSLLNKKMPKQVALGPVERHTAVSATIVEPRCHRALPLVLANMRKSLPESPVQLFYSPSNEDYAKQVGDLLADVFSEDPAFGTAATWLTLTPAEMSLSSPEDYSRLLESVDFWEKVQGELVLIFQTDSWICHNAPKKLNQFLGYAYTGAPWHHDVPSCRDVGNGGLSLRKRDAMRTIVANKKGSAPWSDVVPEDVFFCSELERTGLGAVVAPANIAGSFSDEELLDHDMDPFGVHKPWGRHYSWQKLVRNCPGLDLLHGAQSLETECSVDSMSRAKDLLIEYKVAQASLSDAVRDGLKDQEVRAD